MVKDHSDSERGNRGCHMGYSFRLAARFFLYSPSHGLCYTSRGALAGTRNSSMGPAHEGLIRWPITPWANALTTELHLSPEVTKKIKHTPTLLSWDRFCLVRQEFTALRVISSREQLVKVSLVRSVLARLCILVTARHRVVTHVDVRCGTIRNKSKSQWRGRKFYLTTIATNFNYSYKTSDICDTHQQNQSYGHIFQNWGYFECPNVAKQHYEKIQFKDSMVFI